MAGGPVSPISTFPVTVDRVFANVHEGDGANSKQDIGLGVEASVGADSIWRLRFKMPEVLPATGTGKLQLWALADAITGVAKVNPKWASVAPGEDPSSATLNAETAGTITWSTNDDDEYQELKITLDADTLVAGEMVVMDLTFETASWTLAQISTWYPWIIWE